MKTIQYTIQDPMGIHARPAGMLAKEAGKYACNITVAVEDGNSVDAKRIMGVMRLAAKQGMQLNMTFDGADEDTAAAAFEAFLKENL